MEIEISSLLYLSNTDYLSILYKCNHRPTGRCHHWLYGRPISVQLYEPDLLVGKLDDEYSILKNRTEPDHLKLLEKLDNIEDEFDIDLEPMETII
tara:strand:- start:1378 stop:1662 length:285 start_codon:yes stop_codon:yes gene_type:complete